MGALTRCSRQITLALAVLAASVHANPYQADLEAIKEQAKEITGAAPSLLGAEWLKRIQYPDNPFQQEATAIARQSAAQALKQEMFEQDRKTMEGYTLLVFASYSLGDAALREILRSVAGIPNAAVVFRGIPEGMRIDTGMRPVQRMAAELDPVPNVILHPKLFQQYNVQSVPTIVSVGEDKQAVASVKGLSDPSWLERQVAAGRTGDLGQHGPVMDIAERDLIEVMKERVAQIDWSQKKAAAMARFWSNQSFISLPVATTSQVRRIDPTVVVTADIQAPDGKYIARQGDRLNPLTLRQFERTYVIFNPADKRQLERVRAYLEKQGSPPVAWIATEIPDASWDGYRALTAELRSELFILTSDVRSRFEIERVPSILTADSSHFIVTELGMDEE